MPTVGPTPPGIQIDDAVPQRGGESPLTLKRVVLGATIIGILGIAFAGPHFLSLNNVVLAIALFGLMAQAQAWNLIGGFGGQFSLGQAVFVGIGGYATGLLLLHTGLPLAVIVLLAGVVAALISAVLAVPLLRLRGVSFAVGTLAVLLAFQSWMINWGYAGRTSGLNLPPDALLSFNTQYYAALSLVIATTVVVVVIAKTRFGLRLMAVRDNEGAAAQSGVNGFSVKFGAFVISAFLVGVAGALNAFQQLSLEPYSAFSFEWSTNMIIACVIGGLATYPGPLIGAFVIFALQQKLQGYAYWNTLIEGGMLVAIIVLAPGGIWGVVKRIAGVIGTKGTARFRQQEVEL